MKDGGPIREELVGHWGERGQGKSESEVAAQPWGWFGVKEGAKLLWYPVAPPERLPRHTPKPSAKVYKYFWGVFIFVAFIVTGFNL